VGASGRVIVSARRRSVDAVTSEISLQQSLFDDGPPSIDATFAGIERVQLDEASWLDYCPGWVTGADELFERMLAGGRWGQRTVTMYEKTMLEPRLTAAFANDVADPGTPPELVEITGLLSARYAVVLDRIWVNLYRDGSDSVAWHRDRNGKVHRNPLVATVSLGARRKFQVRRRGTTTIAHTLSPGQGDLVVMGGAMQHDWEHTVPKTKRAVGARMSITIRHSQGELLPGVKPGDLLSWSRPRT
jgi:alkylated DNA repair dioxygenase AlkB